MMHGDPHEHNRHPEVQPDSHSIRAILRELLSLKESLLPLLNHVHVQLHSVMTSIQTFAAAVTANQAKIDAAVEGLTGDVKNLSDQIAALQASAGTITAEDQGLLDSIQASTQVVADKLAALDSLTPVVVPPTTP